MSLALRRYRLPISEGKEIMHQTAKHVTVQSRYVTECVHLGSVLLQYIPTAEQRADIFTKALSGPVFRYHRDSFMTGASIAKEKALLAIRMVDIPKSKHVLKLLVTLRNFSTLLAEARWAMLIAGVSASHQHQLSMHREQVARLVRLIRCQTRRIIGKSRSWISLELPETQNASSGSVGPA